MKKLKNLSFRMQLLFSSILIMIIPNILFGVISVNRNSTKMISEYKSSMSAVTTQTSAALNTVLQDACKVADMPLLSDDVRHAMITDFGDDYLSYARSSNTFRSLFRQTSRLNSSLEACVFINRYGQTFEYNVNSVAKKTAIYQNIEDMEPLARSASNYTFFGHPQADPILGNNKITIPMVKILFDRYDFSETGICYCEINIKSVRTLLESAAGDDSRFLILDAEGNLIYSSSDGFISPEISSSLQHEISGFVGRLPEDGTMEQREFALGKSKYFVNGTINQTTRWALVQYIGNHAITQIRYSNYLTYLKIFLFSILLGMVFAIFMSRILTDPLEKLCLQIDRNSSSGVFYIDDSEFRSNQEMRVLIRSFNRMNEQLQLSMKQTYQAVLTEQKMRIQMLQFQINHHFLYNTFNMINSLAVLHDVPEIGTIAVNISDMMRYGLERFPSASLEEELVQVRRYLTIQDIRFPGKFVFDFNVPKEYMNLEVPVFLLEPIVENSVEHGFRNIEKDCRISILCQAEGGFLHILVLDNGVGMSPAEVEEVNRRLCGRGPFAEKQQAQPGDSMSNALPASSDNPKSASHHHSIGLSNINERIQDFYGNSASVTVESQEGSGTIVDVAVPLILKQE